jgi:hypothetical protein
LRSSPSSYLRTVSVLLAMLSNIGATTNLLGYDARSLWMEVLANEPGRVHMTARSLMALASLITGTPA